MTTPIVMSYSGGKDSSVALHVLRIDPAWNVQRLLTTATQPYNRSSMHGIRVPLLQQQAAAIGLPLDIVWLEAGGSGDAYKQRMEQQIESYLRDGIRHVAFGDLYLEDVRAYREEMNASAGIGSVFPVWGRPTRAFARDFLAAGFRAVVVCVDTTVLDASYCGREFDESFLADLPENVDPCAEKGEFHTFCYAGPIFSEPVPFRQGEQVLRDGRFQYTDLMER